MKKIKVAIVDYPDCLQSALFGFYEVFTLANRVCNEQNLNICFQPHIIKATDTLISDSNHYQLLLLPPSQQSEYYLQPNEHLLCWIKAQHQCGVRIGSACAATFILAATGLLANKQVTTHWGLATQFSESYPRLKLNVDKILINEGDIITAGGMMSWLDLAFEVIGQYSQASVVRMLGKYLVVDTGKREQRFYRQFNPELQHGDALILSIQQHLQVHFSSPQSIKRLSLANNLTERTLLRRFVKATKLKPTQYIQQLRTQKACDLLESTNHSFEVISHQVGYEDAGACRKLFIRYIGLTPTEFRKRFVE